MQSQNSSNRYCATIKGFRWVCNNFFCSIVKNLFKLFFRVKKKLAIKKPKLLFESLGNFASCDRALLNYAIYFKFFNL